MSRLMVLLVGTMLLAAPVSADGWNPDMHKETAEVWCSGYLDPKTRQACVFGFYHGVRFGYGTGRSEGFSAGLELGHGSAASVVKLYRSSAVIKAARMHVATFNSSEGYSYNTENCEIVRNLMQSQPGVVVSYWCEME